MATTTNTRTHILVIPYPAQGHMIPILDLTHHLASTSLFTITIVTTPKNLHLLTTLLSIHSSCITPLVLPFPIPSSSAENTKDLPLMSFRDLMFAYSNLQSPLRQWFCSQTCAPVAIISDFFLGWTHPFAQSLGIQRLVFSPSGAMGLSVIYALWRGMPKKEDHQNDVVLFNELPNLPKYPWWQLSTVYRSYVEGEEISEFIKKGFGDNMKSWGLVINSFDELERDYFGHLKSVLGHDRVWAVGPLIPSEEKVGPDGHKARGGSGSVEADDVLSWLDTCGDDEVVYVSFGTQSTLTGEQMKVVAEGLEKSGVHFIWSVKDSTMTQDHGSVPSGFMDRIEAEGRGRIIKGWAPQVSILRHRAVGTFLTHCGWNSIIEAITAGVALLAWPMGADQFTNATLLVDYLKVGVRVCEGPKSIPNTIELARALTDLVSHRVEYRERMKQLRNDALEAVSEDGSSSRELVGLVKSLTELRIKA